MGENVGMFIISLAVVVAVLELIKSRWPQYAWLYVAVILAGMALYQRAGLTTFLAELRRRMEAR